jgi:hypothetical protein
MTQSRHWIGVASLDHVLRGVAGAFCQLNHGKAAQIRRLSPRDWIVYYSPRQGMNSGEAVQAFTAIGQIEPGEPYAGDMGGGMQAMRRGVSFLDAREAPIRPLLEALSFTAGRASWGYVFRRGSFEVAAKDFRVIARAMGVESAIG